MQDEGSWLDHMTGYLTWKVSGPDIHNPYKALPTLGILRRMTEDASFLMQHISIHCACDGHEVMVIANPDAPRIQTEHPSISSLSNGEIVEYLHRNNLDEFIGDEIEKIRLEIVKLVQQQVAQQKAKMAKPAAEKSDKVKLKAATKSEGGMRIIRR